MPEPIRFLVLVVMSTALASCGSSPDTNNDSSLTTITDEDKANIEVLINGTEAEKGRVRALMETPEEKRQRLDEWREHEEYLKKADAKAIAIEKYLKP